MIKIDKNNTNGKIANFLATYDNLDFEYGEYEDYVEWYKDFYKNIDSERTVIALDIETKQLYPIDNKLLMFAVAYKVDNVYVSKVFNCREWSDSRVVTVINSINKLKSKKLLHNGYFDISTLAIMFDIKLKWDFDTYIIYHSALTHRATDKKDNDFGLENIGLSLKDLTRDFLQYGDYEQEINDFKKNYCKEHKLKSKLFTYDLIPNSILAPYNCMDVVCTLQLYEKSLQLISALQKSGYEKLRKNIRDKHEVTDIYIDSRIRGMVVDRDKVQELAKYYKETMNKAYSDIMTDLKDPIEKVERELYFRKLEKDLMTDFQYIAENRPKITKGGKSKTVEKKVNMTEARAKRYKEESKINFNSAPHKVLLFCETMGLEPLEKTKTGNPKCDINFLEYHGARREELTSFIDYGKCRTALNNFLGVDKVEEDDESISSDAKTLWELTSPTNDVVYSGYNLCGTITGRASCSTPNLQQYPSRGVLKKIKECFIPRKGSKLYYADYSSAEIVILASITQSKNIFQALENGYDLHSVNVWKMLKDRVLEDDPTFQDRFDACGDDVNKLREFYASIKAKYENTLRYHCKSLQFSLAYGTTAYGVRDNLKISLKEAKDLINRFMEANPDMKTYVDYQHKKAMKYGFTENPFGVRLMLPDCPNMYCGDRAIAERAKKQLRKSLNFPIN